MLYGKNHTQCIESLSTHKSENMNYLRICRVLNIFYAISVYSVSKYSGEITTAVFWAYSVFQLRLSRNLRCLFMFIFAFMLMFNS